MKALKGNKVYTISELEKAHYVALGFDIQDDNGTIIIHGKGKTIPYETYAEVVKELEELRANQDRGKGIDTLSEMTVEELKAYAEVNGIDLGQSSSQDGILKKIRTAQKE